MERNTLDSCLDSSLDSDGHRYLIRLLAELLHVHHQSNDRVAWAAITITVDRSSVVWWIRVNKAIHSNKRMAAYGLAAPIVPPNNAVMHDDKTALLDLLTRDLPDDRIRDVMATLRLQCIPPSRLSSE